ncbi:MAG: hypothetical protein FJY56_20765 [Betaproteobacteria bacterium]|nr:hypothetical protein [Betaproteobacteria bacterium]
MKTPSLPKAIWPPRVDTQIETRVRTEQVRMLFRQLPRTFTGTVAGGLVLAAALLTQHPLWLIALRLAAVVLVQIARLSLYFYDKRTGFVDRNPGRAAIFWTSGTLMSGLVLGSIAFIFFQSGELVYQAVLAVAIFTACTAAVPMIGSHMPAFYAFLFPAVIPIIARNAMEGDVAHITIAVLMVMMLIAYLSFGRDYNRMLLESLRDRF